MSRYLVTHVGWGVMRWSNPDQRLVTCSERRPMDNLAGGVALRLFASANAARYAIALTCERPNGTLVEDPSNFRLTRVDVDGPAVEVSL